VLQKAHCRKVQLGSMNGWCSQLCVSTILDDPKGDRDGLLANVDDSYYAIINKCTHAGGSLAQGVLEGSIVTCPRHGARFDVKTGKAVGEAKIGFIKMKVKDEESCMVKVEGTDIMVGIP